MGAWGTGSFENDDAMDWVYELEEAENESVILEALNIVVKRGDEYLDAYESCRALAAAEVVAALKNSPSSDLPNEINQWISKHQNIELSQLTHMAINAIQRIKTHSELKDLWNESNSATEWNQVIENLEARLTQ